MNGITFTGLKNIGGCLFSKSNLATSKSVVRNSMIMQLTDDFSGKDLTAFENVIKECDAEIWYRSFPEDNRILHIMTEYEKDLEKEVEKIVPRLYLNYNPVPVNKKTLPLFSFIAKLTRRISNMEDEEFVRAADFVYGPIGRIALMPEYDMLALAHYFNCKFKTFMDEIPFNNNSSRKFAKEINNNIKAQMIDYLG